MTERKRSGGVRKRCLGKNGSWRLFSATPVLPAGTFLSGTSVCNITRPRLPNGESVSIVSK